MDETATATAGLTLLGARIAHAIAARQRRDSRREALAVILGSLAGAAVLSLFLLVTTREASTLLVIPVLGLSAGVGISLWIAAAWAPFTARRSDSLN